MRRTLCRSLSWFSPTHLLIHRCAKVNLAVKKQFPLGFSESICTLGRITEMWWMNGHSAAAVKMSFDELEASWFRFTSCQLVCADRKSFIFAESADILRCLIIRCLWSWHELDRCVTSSWKAVDSCSSWCWSVLRRWLHRLQIYIRKK